MVTELPMFPIFLKAIFFLELYYAYDQETRYC